MINLRYVPKRHFYLACSGGVDSIAAAHILKRKKFDFSIFHFNHRYQAINNQMETAVASFCDKYEIPFLLGSRPISDTLTERESVEAQLHSRRQDAFRRLGGDIVTAHHLDDCVESHVMNFFNGNEAFVPIPICTKIGEYEIVRPFLLNSKEDFVRYALNNNLSDFIVEDPTNKDNNFRRNWVRNDLLPSLKERQIGLKKIVKKRIENAYKQTFDTDL